MRKQNKKKYRIVCNINIIRDTMYQMWVHYKIDDRTKPYYENLVIDVGKKEIRRVK